MKRISKQIALLVLMVFAGLFIASCGETKRYNVTFDANGGTLTGESVLYVNDGEKVKKPTDPTNTGYRFLGWFISDDEGETLLLKWDFDEKAVDTNIVLYAGWEEIVDDERVLSILEVLNLDDDEAALTEGVVYFVGDGGFYIADESNSLYVEYASIVVNIGEKLLVEGTYKIEDNRPVLKAELVSLLDEEQDILETVNKTVAEVAALDPSDVLSWYGYFKVEGVLKYNSALREYMLVSENLNDELVIISSDNEALNALIGERIKVDVLLVEYNSFSNSWKVLFVEESLEEYNYTEAELKVILNSFFNKEVLSEVLGGGLTLPALMDEVIGLTITWESTIDLIEILPKAAGENVYRTIVQVPEEDTQGKLFATIAYKELDEFEMELDVLVRTLVKTSLKDAILDKDFRSLFDAVVIGFAAGQNITFKSYIVQDLEDPSVIITVDYHIEEGLFGSYIDNVEIGDILTFTAQYRESGRPTFLEVDTVAKGETQDPVYDLENAPVLNSDTFGNFPGYNSFVKLDNPYLQYSTSGMPADTNWVRLSPNANQMTGKFGLANDKTLAFLIRPLDELVGSNWRMTLDVPTTTGDPVLYEGSIYGFVLYESATYFQFVAVSEDHFKPSDGLLIKLLLSEEMPNRVESGNIELLTEHDVVDGLITWTSSDESIVDVTGKVTYPEVDETVTLTATFKPLDSEEEQSISFDVVIVGQVRVVLEVSDVLELDSGEFFNLGGYVLQFGYSESTASPSTSKLNEVFLQDRVTGQILIVLDLADKVNIGDEVEFFGQVDIDDEGKLVVSYKEDLRLVDSDVVLLDYKDGAIKVESYAEALLEFDKDFHFGQVFHFVGPAFFNSTTTSGRMTNLRFHLNPNASGLADLRMGGKSLVFNINSNAPAVGADFAEELFGIEGNPFTIYPGLEKHLDFYFVVKHYSASYYYVVLLSEDDVVKHAVDIVVERDIKDLVPTEVIAGDMTLPVEHELLDGPITWASNNEAVIDATGKVTYPAEEELVELTFSFDHGGESYSFVIEVSVKAAVPKSVSEIIDEAEDGDVVYVEAIVVGFHWNGSNNVNYTTYNGVILKDATGNDLLYVDGLYENYGEERFAYKVGEDTLAKGDKIRFVANYTVATSAGHAGRKTLVIDNAESANMTIVAREVEYTFNLDEAVEVTGQEDLEDIAENLPYGTLFKISGDFGFRGSASTYGTGVNLQTSYVRGAATDYNMPVSWADRGQRFSFKFDGNDPNLGNKWYEDILGINSDTYTGTAASGMTFEEGAYIYFYLGHSLPTAATSNGYIQLVILEREWINATLK